MGWYYSWRIKSDSPSRPSVSWPGRFRPSSKEKLSKSRAGSRRCLLRRHACADPLAKPDHGRPTSPTGRGQCRRINRRSHRRLALLGGPRLLLLTYAYPPKAHGGARRHCRLQSWLGWPASSMGGGGFWWILVVRAAGRGISRRPTSIIKQGGGRFASLEGVSFRQACMTRADRSC